eukprot:2990797-Pyramimonas_sp.AAC.1
MDPTMPINFLQLVGAEWGKYHFMIFLSKNVYLDAPPEKYELPGLSDIPFIDEDPYESTEYLSTTGTDRRRRRHGSHTSGNSRAAAMEETNISSEQLRPLTPQTPERDRQTFERSPISPR